MIKKIIISSIVFYQKVISPLKPKSCRFYPSCSEYAKLSIEKYGVLVGGIKAFKRIIKCHPFHPGGYDPV
ncbi:membrane protein insertion efficiency factor YidD [Fervidicola ferrireducens]|uniref:membrane protein insertion efficiency factor YidD n=1 Tax=Fervidicola ferrireducens TaxID=520764 RepID=UPI000A44A5A2|nr:membrane protein insertion efficiency factor YidD [Fervidicola ferrireducens]